MAAPPHRFVVHAMIQHPGPAAAVAFLWSLDHCSTWGHGGIHAPVIRQQGHYYVLLCTFPPGSGCPSNPMPSSKWQCCENSWKKKVDRGGVVRLLYKQIGRTSCLSDLGHCSRSRLMQFGVDLRSGHINNIQGRRAIEIGE